MVVNGDNGGGTRSKKLTNCTMRTSTWIICTTPAVPYPIATPISLVNQHYPSNYAPPLFNYVNISLLHLDVASGPITGDTNVVVYSNDMYQFLNSSMMKCRFNHSKIDTQVRYDTAPVIISPSQIKCKTPRFSATGDYVVSVTFNGQQYVEMEDPTDRNVMFSVYDIKFDHIFPIAGPKLGSRVTIFGTGFHDAYKPASIPIVNLGGGIMCFASFYQLPNGNWSMIFNTPPDLDLLGQPLSINVLPNAQQSLDSGLFFMLYPDHGLGSVSPVMFPHVLSNPHADRRIELTPSIGSVFADIHQPPMVRLIRLGPNVGPREFQLVASLHDSTSIRVLIPDDFQSGTYSVAVSLNRKYFSRSREISIFSLNVHRDAYGPTTGGSELDVSGTGFMNLGSNLVCTYSQGGHVVSGDGYFSMSIPATFKSNTQITCNTPILNPGSYNLSVSGDIGVMYTSLNASYIVYDPPIVTGVTPKKVQLGEPAILYITGDFFMETGMISVAIGDMSMPGTVINRTTIMCHTKPRYIPLTGVVRMALNGQQFTSNPDVLVAFANSCPQGEMPPGTGVGCVPCPAGTFKSTISNSPCEQCIVDSYCPKGSIKPIKCPVFSNAEAGSQDQYDCICRGDFYWNHATQQCNECPPGAQW
eukprot:TRINITY_DN2019_c1_g2_i6.p1 TRINITY_DN2019_c1_g2~~TRINITY_DN2019_c1_g2_i6.p1  ORF type:complete len:642 (+),score=115.78 TRINITY_DN2019_c1_g2_i6:2840-4765(+)